MRVLHFRKKFSVLSEVPIYDYITGLERQGLTNDVVTLAHENADSRPFERVHVVSSPGPLHPIRVAHYLLRRLRKDANEGASWPVVRRRLGRLTARLSPDVIHAHRGPEAVLISPVAAALRIPLVVTFYGSDISRLPQNEAWRARYAHLWRDVAAVTVLSADMRKDAMGLGCPPGRLHVVHIGRDVGSLEGRSVPHPVRHFISVGRLVEKKGHLDVIRAFARVAAARRDLRLTLVGDGPLRSQLEHLILELGLGARVSLVGARPLSQTIALMRRADALILGSKTAGDGDREGTPGVLIEAQLLGLPCVATWHAGIPETVPPENHRLLAGEGHVEEIADRVAWLIGRPRTALEDIVAHGRRFVRDNFDVGRQAAQLRRVYESAADGGPPRTRRRPRAGTA
jgi:glycosyltransferase involved in cell wall biosynthesis